MPKNIPTPDELKFRNAAVFQFTQNGYSRRLGEERLSTACGWIRNPCSPLKRFRCRNTPWSCIANIMGPNVINGAIKKSGQKLGALSRTSRTHNSTVRRTVLHKLFAREQHGAQRPVALSATDVVYQNYVYLSSKYREERRLPITRTHDKIHHYSLPGSRLRIESLPADAAGRTVCP